MTAAPPQPVSPHIRRLGDAVVAGGLGSLVITPDEIARARGLALRGPSVPAPDRSLATFVGEWAGRTPEAVAVVGAGHRTTYAELDTLVSAARCGLSALGVSVGEVVGVHGPRARETLVTFLALDSLGAVYLPLEEAWPGDRTATVLADSGASHVVTTSERGAVDLRREAARLEVAVHRAAEVLGQPVERAVPLHEPDLTQYVIYTSGTTGVPKGAVVERAGMLNHLLAKIQDLGLGPEDVVAFTAPIGFDISVWQMVCPLVCGASAVVVDEADLAFPSRLAALVEREQVSVLELVPTVINQLMGHLGRRSAAVAQLATLRWLISTGEELLPPLASQVLRALPDVGLMNAYGPTECSDDVTHHVVTVRDTDDIRLPVGAPIANTTVYVLVHDAGEWRATDDGETGEIFVGGAGVGPGYLHRPDVSAAAFAEDVLDPTSPTHRLYRSGDAGRIADGVVHYLGRIDRQVKVSGVRMELDEIEAVLSRHADVAQCAVTVRREADTTHLVAHVVPGPRGPATHAQLRAHLERHVPAVMVPRTWRSWPTLPLTANGKVDHRRLQDEGETHGV